VAGWNEGILVTTQAQVREFLRSLAYEAQGDDPAPGGGNDQPCRGVAVRR
jgi:hypothetical protein